jgi:hypothetical protein
MVERTPMPALVRRIAPAAAVVLGVAAVLKVVYDPWYLNYDARYALLWAQDLVGGFAPEYRADFAPTPRPFQTAVALVLLVFGEGADTALSWFTLLAYGLLGVLAFLVGRRLFSPGAGVVAALVVLTRPAIHRDAVLGYQDLPFAALVFLAVFLEAGRRRRGAPVLGVLALAGLIRPEAWVLGGLYWLYLAWPQVAARRRGVAAAADAPGARQLAGLLGLVAAAPLLWALSDLLITGDALHSLHGTSELAEDNDRRRFVHQVPYWTAQYFGFTLREPLVLGVPVGLFFAWRHRRDRSAALPLAVAAAMVAVFALGPFFGLPLIGRYVRTPAMLLALFYGLAVVGWRMLPAGAARERWKIAGVVTALASVAFLPWHAGMLSAMERRFDRDGQLYGDLRDAARAPAVTAAFARCPSLTAADHRPIPYVRDWLDGDPGTVGTTAKGASPLGDLHLVPRRTELPRRFYRANFPPGTDPPPGYTTLYSNRSYRVYVSPRCA